MSMCRAVRRAGIREIPVCAIRGTLEPSRSAQFDPDFRPAGIARSRWQRVWLAEQRGTNLPPVSVVAVGDDYVLRDGHHRVSVARARGRADDRRDGGRRLSSRLPSRRCWPASSPPFSPRGSSS